LESTIIGEFDTRRDAELAVEHVVQDCGVRSDVFVRPVGGANTSGTRPAGADAKAAPTPEAHQKLDGLLEVSVGCHGDDPERIAGFFPFGIEIRCRLPELSGRNQTSRAAIFHIVPFAKRTYFLTAVGLAVPPCWHFG
jgi:hypothetical protein